MTTITIDHRHIFYLDADDRPHSLPPHHFERLWRGEPDGAMPELANQRVRFVVSHVERFTSPPRVLFECHPVLCLDDRGHIDVELHKAQLHAAVGLLEVNDHVPVLSDALATDHALVTVWYPDPAIRRRLTSALTVATIYRSRATLGARCSRASES